jgi:hypothetical protein
VACDAATGDVCQPQLAKTRPQGEHMLKRIALIGIFVVASAFSITAQSAAPQKSVPSMSVPKAPVPQGFCPQGQGHC